ESAQNDKEKRPPDIIFAKRNIDKRQSRKSRQDGCNVKRAFHRLGRNGSALYRARRTDAIFVIGTFYAVAVIIGEIGKDLQQKRGQQREQYDLPIEGRARHGVKTSDKDSRYRQG